MALPVKYCPDCGEERSTEEFYKNLAQSSGFSSYCKKHERLRRKGYRDGELEWKRYLKRNYNISAKEYYELLENQGGGCAICGMTEEELGQHLSVDHNHRCCPQRKKSCGMCVRGLLCPNCNNGLGRFQDNPELLLKAFEYSGGVI
jgi:hypothetical protein